MWSATNRTWSILARLVRAFVGARLAADLLLARTCVGGPKPDSRIHTVTNTDRASFVTIKGGTMSATMSTKFLEGYREMPVLFTADQDIPRKSKSNLEEETEDVDRVFLLLHRAF